MIVQKLDVARLEIHIQAKLVAGSESVEHVHGFNL